MFALSDITRIRPDSLGLSTNWEDIVLVDVRDIDFYTGYIPGSLHFPWTDFDNNVSQLCEEYASAEKRIIFLCFNSQRRALFCARRFLLHLNEHVSKPKCEISILEGGFQSWKATFGKDDTKSSYVSTVYDQSKMATEGSLPICDPLPKDSKQASPQTLLAQKQIVPAGEKWRSELKVGDTVEMYSQIEQMHYRGIIAKADEHKLHVSFFRDKKCGNRVISRMSEDLGVVSDSKHCDSSVTQSCITKSYSDGLTGAMSTDVQSLDNGNIVQRKTRRAKTMSDAISLSKALAHEDGGACYDCADDSKWRRQLQVGNYLDIYSRSDNDWQKALVVSGDTASINVRFFRDGKCCAKVVQRSSEDLRSPLSNKPTLPQVQKPPLPKQGGFTRVLSPGGQLSDAIPTVFAEDLAKSLGDTMLQVIDVRGLDYLTGHIPGARHVPRQFFEEKIPSLANEFAQSGKTLVFHCTESFYRGPQCARRFLEYINEEYEMHACQVFVLKGGYERWECFVRGAGGTATLPTNLIEASKSVPPDALSMYD